MVPAPLTTPTITSNFLAWLKYTQIPTDCGIHCIDTRLDRLSFEDPTGSVMRHMLAYNGICQTPSNHGSWVVLSIRERQSHPSAQLVVCRRTWATRSETDNRHDLFYSLDFDKSPWDPSRLDDAAKHTWEVFWNHLSHTITNQVEIARGLADRGIPQIVTA